jgi:membrane protein required for colicin V production
MPQTMTLTWIDWATLAIVLVAILRGSQRGFLSGLVDLVVLVAAFFAASALYTRGALYLKKVLILPGAWEALASFVIIWLVLYIGVSLLIRWFLRENMSTASRIVGGVLGGIRGLAIVTILLALVLAAPIQGAVKKDVTRSRVAPYLLRAQDRIMTALLPALPVRIPRIGPGGRSF